MAAPVLMIVAALVPALALADPSSDSATLVQLGLRSRTAWDTFAPKPGVTPISDKDVELVVASHCESTAWLHGWTGPLTMYNKGGKACEASLLQSLEQPHLAGARGRVVTLQNRGREGQSYLEHIVDNYDNLAPFTAFVQGAGEHNGVKAMDKVHNFRALGNRTVSVFPIVHENDNGPILYRDADPDEKVDINREGLDTANVYVFPFGGAPVADKARALYMSLFGGTACEAPPMNFAAGAQFIVSREAIHAKPKAFWQHMATGLQQARCEELGYVLERVWLFLFDPTIQPAKELGEFPDYCVWRGARLSKNRGDCKEYKKSEPVPSFKDIMNRPWTKEKTIAR